MSDPADAERRQGHSKLVYDKATRTIVPVDPHPHEPTDAEVERIVKIACDAGDVHLTCSYPACTCKQMPKVARAVLAALPARAEIERQARERALRAVDECFGRELLTLSILVQGFGSSSHIAYAKERMEALRKVLALIPQEPQS